MEQQHNEAVETQEQVDTQEKDMAEQQKAEKTFTRADVAKMLSAERAKWQSDLEKQQTEAEKLAKMNAEEKLKYETDQLMARIKELEDEKTMRDMTATARGMLSEAKIGAPDELLARLVTSDAENTKNAVQAFISTFNESVEKAVQERLKGATPKHTSGGVAITKEQIMAVADRTERQRLIEQNQALFTGQ